MTWWSLFIQTLYSCYTTSWDSTKGGEERGANATSAIDSVIAVLDRRIERYKGKTYKSKQSKKAGKNLSITTEPCTLADLVTTELHEEDEVVDVGGKVVRVKRFPVKPMTVDDAAFQMELLGHSFFLFLNSETDDHNVLYRRRDGDYGLMQPEAL